MSNLNYFTGRSLRVGFNINLDNHHINHARSNLTITQNYPEFGIETRHINKITKEMAIIYGWILYHYKFKYQGVFSARFDKQDEDDQMLDEIDLFINLKINHNLTESDIDETDGKSQFEYEIHQQEMKDLGWIFNKSISMTVHFYQTGILIGSNYVIVSLRSSAILIIEKDDKFCFLWPFLAYLRTCDDSHPNRISNHRQNFNEIFIEEFDFSNGFICNDVHRFNKLNKLSLSKFELHFYQNQNGWKYKLIPIEFGENVSDRVIDLLIYKTHYALIKKLNVFSGNHSFKFFCKKRFSF